MRFGICNRADNCGYTESPYARLPDGSTYAQQIKQEERSE